MMDETEIKWLEPWVPISSDNYFEKELYREVGVNHILFSKKVVAIGRREDRDDVLFVVYDSEFKLAVVHLTFSRNREENAFYPRTRLFKDINDWTQNCMMPDHLEYTIENE